MESALYTHLTKFININQKEFSEILKFFDKKTLNKKEEIMSIGERCHYLYFVTRGCLYMYTCNEDGVEKTIQFAIENWWMTDTLAFTSQHISSFGIRAALTSEILEISFTKYQELLEKHPKLEKYFRMVNENAYGAALMRFQFLFNHSKEEIYHHFNDHFPEFTNRIPQYLLASYLNLTPEYLSQIRRKAIS